MGSCASVQNVITELEWMLTGSMYGEERRGSWLRGRSEWVVLKDFNLGLPEDRIVIGFFEASNVMCLERELWENPTIVCWRSRMGPFEVSAFYTSGSAL